MKCSLSRLFLAAFLLFGSTLALAEPLYFGAPPREGGEIKSKAFYKPIVDALSELLGTPVVHKYRENFFKYGAEMRKDGFDIVFDGPHFASWRINELGHKPVVVLPGNLRFLVITRKDNPKVTGKRSLVAKRICGPSMPNLGTLTALDSYKGSLIQQPIFEAIQGGMKGSYIAFKKGRCDAVVLRDGFYMKKIKGAEKENLRIVFPTRAQPNQTITISSRMTEDQLNQITAFFTSTVGASVADNLLSRFSKKQKAFLPVTDGSVYNDLDKPLIKHAWGWSKRLASR